MELNMKSSQFSENAKTVFAPNKLEWAIIIVFILLVVAIPSYYFYSKYQKSQVLLQNSNAATNTEIKDVVQKVGMLIVLPSNEVPTVAKVSDKTQLPSGQFFTNVQNGDEVLIYPIAKELILYRPSINKLIEVTQGVIAPLTSPTPAAEQNATPSSKIIPSATPTIQP